MTQCDSGIDGYFIFSKDRVNCLSVTSKEQYIEKVMLANWQACMQVKGLREGLPVIYWIHWSSAQSIAWNCCSCHLVIGIMQATTAEVSIDAPMPRVQTSSEKAWQCSLKKLQSKIDDHPWLPSCIHLLGLNTSRLLSTTIVKLACLSWSRPSRPGKGVRQRLGLVLKKVKTKKDDMTLQKRIGVGRPAKVFKTFTPIAVQLQGQMYNNALSAKDLYRWADSADSSGAQGLKDVSEVAVQGYKASNLARDMRKALRQAELQWARLLWGHALLWQVSNDPTSRSWR